MARTLPRPPPPAGAAGRRRRLLALEGDEQLAQQPGQRVALVVAERREQRALVVQVVGRDAIDERAALARELDERSAAVVWIGDAADETGALEGGEAMGHRARRPHQCDVELGGGEAVRRTHPPQAREDVP